MSREGEPQHQKSNLISRKGLLHRGLIFAAGIATGASCNTFWNQRSQEGKGALLVPQLNPNPTIVPLDRDSDKDVSQEFPGRVAEREVFGFLRLNQIDQFVELEKYRWSVNSLTTLALFGIPVDEQGNLGIKDPEFTPIDSSKASQVINLARDRKVRPVLTLTQFDLPKIRSILDSKSAQQRSIDQTLGLVDKYRLQGVNVDFEWFEGVDSRYRRALTSYVQMLGEALHKEKDTHQLSVSVGVLAGKFENRIWDIEGLSKVSDLLFIMGYGFSGVAYQGAIPTAPLYGFAEGKYEEGDISDSINYLTQKAPRSKLALGIPFYGYNFLVNSPGLGGVIAGEFNALTYSQAINRYRLKDNTIIGWDDLGKVEWASTSLGGLYDVTVVGGPKFYREMVTFVRDRRLRGIGSWALDMVTYGSVEERFWQPFEAYRQGKPLETPAKLTTLDGRLESLVMFAQNDKRWSGVGTTETAFASILSTYGTRVTPDQIAKIFLDKGIRTADKGIVVRPKALDWLAAEHKMEVKRNFDRHDDRLSQTERSKSFNFDEAAKSLSQGYLIVGNGKALWNDDYYPQGKEAVFVILDVDKNNQKLTVYDPSDATVRRVPLSTLPELYFAYAVKPR